MGGVGGQVEEWVTTLTTLRNVKVEGMKNVVVFGAVASLSWEAED